jgi:hypothetical protein
MRTLETVVMLSCKGTSGPESRPAGRGDRSSGDVDEFAAIYVAADMDASNLAMR